MSTLASLLATSTSTVHAAMRVVKGILRSMLRRGRLALLLALAVGSAPVALEVCRIACESMQMHPIVAHTTAHHSSCHESGTGAPTASVHAHTCHHGSETTPGIAVARPSDHATPLAAGLPATHTAAFVGRSARPSEGPSLLPALAAVRLAIPLRI